MGNALEPSNVQPSEVTRALSRRAFLGGGAAALATAAALTPKARAATLAYQRAIDLAQPGPSQWEALRALGRTSLRAPGSKPMASAAAGTDTLPEIEHVVVLMLENHSYDNLLGMLGRERGQQPRGDGFTLAKDGYPTATNPYPGGTRQLRAFHMPTTCQLHGKPSQEWEQSHIQYDNGRNDGFVISNSGPVAMGYWTERDLPFTYDLARQFPIGDRWFSSCLAQTDPQRRYLIAATSSGMTDDIGGSIGGLEPDLLLGTPPNGTIFERMSSAGISWADYNASFPTGATMELYPEPDGAYSTTNAKPIAQFFSDAAAGKLPSFSLLDPDYGKQSQEDPQNIVVGEAFLEKVVRALGASPSWSKTMLIFTYDEHGGYYDHVPPPPALAPDGIAPVVQPGESTYEGFRRYGFRVPSVVVSPYAKRSHVSHVLYDHTSILAFLERKWNLPSMTYRDANANDLTDFLDLQAIAAREPTFPELPKLAASGDTPAAHVCDTAGPGTIPPPTPPKLPPIRLELRHVRLHRRSRDLTLQLRTTHGTLHDLDVQLVHGPHHIGHHYLHKVSAHWRTVTLHATAHHRLGSRRYTLLVKQGRHTLAQRKVR